MNKHQHETPHGHHKQEKHTKKGPPTHAQAKREVHKDWRLWVAVGLMLAAMAGYVITMDESLQPEGNGQEVPAAAE